VTSQVFLRYESFTNFAHILSDISDIPSLTSKSASRVILALTFVEDVMFLASCEKCIGRFLTTTCH